MDGILRELTSRAVLDGLMVDWLRARCADRAGALDSALLELDLITEDDLAAGIEAAHSATAVRPEDLADVDAGVAARIPASASDSFGLCPLYWRDARLVVLVEAPLPVASFLELHELFGVEVTQLVGTSFHIALARHAVYGADLDEAARELAARLARRRDADVRTTLERLQLCSSLADAAHELLALAERLLEVACFFVVADGQLGLIASPGVAPAAAVALPGPGCTLAPAIRHGGYFLGPLQGGDADQRFYASLGRPVPEWAFVAPVPAAEGTAVFYADNGPRGIAKRWVAELTLLVARVSRFGGDWRRLARQPAAAPAPPAPDAAVVAEAPALESMPVVAPPPDETTMLPLTRSEITALYLLRREAADAGVPIDELVERLLGEAPAPRAAATPAPAAAAPAPAAPPAAEAPDPAALAGEVRGLFDKLATDIPAQLARGMEAAFRDLVPRIAAAVPARPAARAAAAPARAADVELVQKSDAPREVPSYRSRRGKTKRIKL